MKYVKKKWPTQNCDHAMSITSAVKAFFPTRSVFIKPSICNYILGYKYKSK